MMLLQLLAFGISLSGSAWGGEGITIDTHWDLGPQVPPPATVDIVFHERIGQPWIGDELSGLIVVHNQSGLALDLDSAWRSCSCSVSQEIVSSRHIEPGEIEDVPFSIAVLEPIASHEFRLSFRSVNTTTECKVRIDVEAKPRFWGFSYGWLERGDAGPLLAVDYHAQDVPIPRPELFGIRGGVLDSVVETEGGGTAFFRLGFERFGASVPGRLPYVVVQSSAGLPLAVLGDDGLDRMPAIQVPARFVPGVGLKVRLDQDSLPIDMRGSESPARCLVYGLAAPLFVSVPVGGAEIVIPEEDLGRWDTGRIVLYVLDPPRKTLEGVRLSPLPVRGSDLLSSLGLENRAQSKPGRPGKD